MMLIDYMINNEIYDYTDSFKKIIIKLPFRFLYTLTKMQKYP